MPALSRVEEGEGVGLLTRHAARSLVLRQHVVDITSRHGQRSQLAEGGNRAKGSRTSIRTKVGKVLLRVETTGLWGPWPSGVMSCSLLSQVPVLSLEGFGPVTLRVRREPFGLGAHETSRHRSWAAREHARARDEEFVARTLKCARTRCCGALECECKLGALGRFASAFWSAS